MLLADHLCVRGLEEAYHAVSGEEAQLLSVHQSA
jgi:hypothetical protein